MHAKIFNAINFAIAAHIGQFRKGKNIPYITHPMSVSLVLAHAGAKDEVVVAGLLHDTVEDSGVTKQEITEKFGENVASLVAAATEKDKSLPWIERKMRSLSEMDEMTKDALLLKSADILCNMSDLVSDYKEKGDKMFEDFNAGKEDQLTRYAKVVKKLEEIYPDNPLLPQLKKTQQDFNGLFPNSHKRW